MRNKNDTICKIYLYLYLDPEGRLPEVRLGEKKNKKKWWFLSKNVNYFVLYKYKYKYIHYTYMDIYLNVYI